LTRTQRSIEKFRQGDACIQVQAAHGRAAAGLAVSVEQERHAFWFGCVVPDLDALTESQRQSYQARLDEIFNHLIPAQSAAACTPDAARVEVRDPIPLGALWRRLDDRACSGLPLEVHIHGRAAGMADVVAGFSEREIGSRVADIYTLCFAHPAVAGIVWNGFVDGVADAGDAGLLRRDLAPKYAHKVLQKLIQHHCHSRAWGHTDSDGLFRFRGFFGDYRIVVDVGGAAARVEKFALNRGQVPLTVIQALR
jgi:hypothetical protein